MAISRKFWNFLAFSITSGLPSALRLLLLPVVASLLGPSGLGRVAYIEAILMFVTVLSFFGIEHYFLKSYFHVDRDRLFSTLSKYLFAHNAVILVLCLAATTLFHDPELRLAFCLASLRMALWTILILPLRELRLQGRALGYATAFTGAGLVQAGLALLFVWLGWGIVGWFLGYLVGLVPFSLFFLVKSLPRLRQPLDRTVLRKALELGKAVTVGTLAMAAVDVADRIALKAFVPFDDIGVYSVGYSIGFAISILCTALYTTFEPALFQPTDVDRDLIPYFKRSLALSLAIVTSFAAFVIASADPFIRAFLPERFAEGGAVSALVAAATPYNLCHLFFTLLAVRLARHRTIVVASVCAAIVNVGLNLFLIPMWGILGAAYGTFLSFATLAAVYGPMVTHWPALRNVYIGALVVPFALALSSQLATSHQVVPMVPLTVAAFGAAWFIWSGDVLDWIPKRTLGN